MRWFWYWLKQQIDWGRAGRAGAVLALLLVGFFACSSIVDTGTEIVRDRPTRTTLSPSQVREREQDKEIVKAACSLWWDGVIELPDDHAQTCVDTGWGK